MTIHNLGTCTDSASYFEKPDLDKRLDNVLDWLDGTEFGLGQVIDRLQHLAAVRAFMNDRSKNPLYRPKRKTGTNHDYIISLRNHGLTYREIAKRLHCSIGLVYKVANRHQNNLLEDE